MKIIDTCGHCEDGLISMSVCPHCWGTTVSVEALAALEAELARAQAAYETKRKANKSLRGRARGLAGNTLRKLGDVVRALEAEVERINTEVALNRTVARVVGAAADREAQLS